MKSVLRKMLIMAALVVFIFDICAIAQDWPQWRGINRDAKVTGFKAPAAWPKTLTKKWNIPTGEGTDSTPALVGDKLYVFTRQAGEEVILCLNAETGKEIWRDKYAVAAITGVDNGHPGPRSSPVVANGKICTLGVTGILSCLDAATGKLIWRKDDFPGAFPRFHTAMSPIIVDNLCIGHFGSADNGAVAGYDLATGDIKWKWSGGSGFGPTYASPVLATLGGIKQVLVQTEKNVVSISLDGKLLWQEASAGGRYGASSPVVDETNSIVFGIRGNGSYAIKITKEGDSFKTEQLWSNADTGTEYNTPILKNGFLFGINPRNNYFCIDAKTGTTAWSVPPTTAAPAAALLTDTDNTLLTPAVYNGSMVITPAAMGGGDRGGRGGGMGGMGGGGMRRGGGGMGGGVGYGTIVDAGSVLFGLISNGRLVVYEPNEKEYKELAAYQVTSGQVYAYQIVSGNRIYTSDQTSVTLWTIE